MDIPDGCPKRESFGVTAMGAFLATRQIGW